MVTINTVFDCYKFIAKKIKTHSFDYGKPIIFYVQIYTYIIIGRYTIIVNTYNRYFA